jgi:hypothetical protein
MDYIAWLSQRMEQGTTDFTVFWGNGFWLVALQNVGIPNGAPEHREQYTGATLSEAMQKMVEGKRQARGEG